MVFTWYSHNIHRFSLRVATAEGPNVLRLMSDWTKLAVGTLCLIFKLKRHNRLPLCSKGG